MDETQPEPVTARAGSTQARILDAAWNLIRERGEVPRVRVADVAAAAGVSRQLVYHHFDSRAGLFEAMTRRYDVVSGFTDRVSALICLEPKAALEGVIREWLNYLPAIAPVALALEAARVNGDAGAVAFPRRMAELRSLFGLLAGRIAEAGWLADGWTVDRAADWIFGQTHLTAWQHMVLECGWPASEHAERTVRSIMAEIVSPRWSAGRAPHRGSRRAPGA